MNQKKAFVIALLTLLLLVSISLIYYLISKKNIENSTSKYVGISMTNDGIILPSRDIKINSQEDFNTNLKISNIVPDNRKYLLKIFCDDDFISYTIDNKTASEQYLNIGSNEVKTYKLNIKNLKENIRHDLILFLIIIPNRNEFSAIERSYGKVVTSRFNITRGGDNKTSIESNNFDVDNYVTHEFPNKFSFAITEKKVTKDTTGLNVLAKLKSKNNKLKLYSYIPNYNSSNVQYKLICLKNWNIVPIMNKKYLLATVKPHNTLEIPIEIPVDQSDNKKDLMFILIPSPHESVDISNIKTLGLKNIPVDLEYSTRMQIISK